MDSHPAEFSLFTFRICRRYVIVTLNVGWIVVRRCQAGQHHHTAGLR
jgi:hypothetical protein